LQGYLFSLLGTHKMDKKVAECIQFAEARAKQVSAREASHIAALRAWFQGDLIRAGAIWDNIVMEYPHDILALRLLHFNIFWMGQNYYLRDSVARAIPAWDDSIPAYGSVLGMYAFGLEECGEYEKAERLGRLGVEINPADLWSIHAVAHVLEMQGRLSDGIDWLNYPLDVWQDRNPFKGHLWWHRALFLLELGDYEQVLALYDSSVRPEPSTFYLDVQNAASLLMRLETLNVDVGDRWAELADDITGSLDDHVLAFNEMHCMMALVSDGHLSDAQHLLESLTRFANTPDNFAASITESAVLPLCQAILAYGTEDYDSAVELLLPLRYDIAAVGGSHAQRDLFTQLLIAAAHRDGRLGLARAFLRERTELRPNSYGNWIKYSEVLSATGDEAGAEAARIKATAIRT